MSAPHTSCPVVSMALKTTSDGETSQTLHPTCVPFLFLVPLVSLFIVCRVVCRCRGSPNEHISHCQVGLSCYRQLRARDEVAHLGKWPRCSRCILSPGLSICCARVCTCVFWTPLCNRSTQGIYLCLVTTLLCPLRVNIVLFPCPRYVQLLSSTHSC